MILGSIVKIGCKEQILSWWKEGNRIFLRKGRKQKHVSVLLPDFVRPTNKVQVQSSSEQYIISNSPIISVIVAFLIRWWRGWQRGFAGLNHPNVPTFVAFCGQGTSTQYVDFSWQGFPRDSHRKAADPNSDKVFTFAGVGGGRQPPLPF